MKKLINLVIIIALLSSCMVVCITAETVVSVSVEGENVDFPDGSPFIDDNNRTLVPVRFISEALGGKVTWDGNLKQVTVEYGEKVIQLIIDNKVITVNGQIQEMDTKAILKDSRTYVPVRFISEAMGTEVDWDPANYTVIIKLKKEEKVALENLTKEQIISELKNYPYIKDVWNEIEGDDKWMVERFGLGTVENYIELGKSFIETFYKVDYSQYNREDYVDKLKWFFRSSAIRHCYDDKVRTGEEYINYWADMVEEKQLNIITEFITDKTCIYTNGNIMIRGRMNYTVVSCNDIEWLKNNTKFGNVELGKKYTAVVDVEFINSLKRSEQKWETADRVFARTYLITEIKEVSE